jgi:hypothetical protein
MVLQPGDVWVIEKAVEDTSDNDANLKTCAIRGWLEPLANAIPSGKLDRDGSLPEKLFTGISSLWKLTDSGWSVIHRQQFWVLVSLLISTLSFLVAILSYWVAIHPLRS